MSSDTTTAESQTDTDIGKPEQKVQPIGYVSPVKQGSLLSTEKIPEKETTREVPAQVPDASTVQSKQAETSAENTVSIGKTIGTYTSQSLKSEQSPIRTTLPTGESGQDARIPYKIPDGVRVYDRDRMNENASSFGFPDRGIGHEFLGPDDLRYLSGFSFAPGCGFYLFSRAMGVFIWVIVAVFFVYAFTLPGGGGDDQLTNNLTKIYFLTQIPLLIWMGKVARRRRWKMLRFQSFQHFKSDEMVWNILGGFGWLSASVLSLYALFGK